MTHRQPNEYVNMTFHPSNILLTLLLMGLTMMFLALTGSYIYSRFYNGLPPIKIPVLFLVNTLLLIASSYTIEMAIRSYKEDATEAYKKALLLTIGLTVCFMAAQYYGWQLLLAANVGISSSPGASYLYLISGLHFLHVLGGLPFLLWFYWVAQRRMVEPVSVLVYFSDPQKQLHLRLLARYWHFLDVLWIYLVVFFYANYFIK